MERNESRIHLYRSQTGQGRIVDSCLISLRIWCEKRYHHVCAGVYCVLASLSTDDPNTIQ